METSCLEITKTISETITALVAVIGVPVVWNQFRLQHRQALYEALTDLHNQVASQPIREGLQSIYRMSPGAKILSKDKHEKNCMELVLDTYDLVGFRVKKGVLPEKATLETEWSVVLRVWKHVENFVKEERKRRNNGTYYKMNLEWLAKKAKEYMKDNEWTDPTKQSDITGEESRSKK